jgi:hypothetical protein
MGSTVVTIPISPIGACIFGGTVILSAYNEVREIAEKANFSEVSSSDKPQDTLNGVKGFLTEKLKAPGFCAWVQGINFVGTATVAAAHGDFWGALALGIFAIGESAGVYVANLNYLPQKREPLSLEKVLNRSYDTLPHNFRTVLRDPGAAFCTGNIIMILKDLNFSKLTSQPLVAGVFVLGAAFASAGVVRGLSPLFTGREAKSSGTASTLGGTGDLFLGSSTLGAGNPYTGVATILWGLSNILYGGRVGTPLLDRFFKRDKITMDNN